MLDRADPAVLNSLPQDLNEAQNLRFLLYGRFGQYICVICVLVVLTVYFTL